MGGYADSSPPGTFDGLKVGNRSKIKKKLYDTNRVKAEWGCLMKQIDKERFMTMAEVYDRLAGYLVFSYHFFR